MKNLKLLIIFVSLFIASCSFNTGEKADQKANESNQKANKSEAETANKSENKENKSDKPLFPDEKKKETSAAKTDCANLKRDGMKLDKKQTFPVDFAPFENSCFATFHEHDFEDPPLGEKFYIYKDGKEIYEFPEQTEAATYTIEGVAFEDLNGDNLTDVIVVGSIGLKFGTVYSSQVYANNSRGFDTNSDANIELDDFTKISEIKNFVKKNQKLFFK